MPLLPDEVSGGASSEASRHYLPCLAVSEQLSGTQGVSSCSFHDAGFLTIELLLHSAAAEVPFGLQIFPERWLQSKLWVSGTGKLDSSDYVIESNVLPQRPTDWSVLEPALLPAIRTCLLPSSATGWHSPADACMQAEPICEALSLYHLLLSRDGKQGECVTGLSPSRPPFGREGHADVPMLLDCAS